jgi:hypothetical protein
MTSRSYLNFAGLTFTAGFVATLVFHQVTVAGLDAAGQMPGGIKPWSFDPVPPFGVFQRPSGAAYGRSCSA